MEVTLTRPQIIGPGKIEYPQTFHKGSGKYVPDVTRAGRVVKLNTGKRGEVVDLPESVAERLCALGNAMIGNIPESKLPSLT